MKYYQSIEEAKREKEMVRQQQLINRLQEGLQAKLKDIKLNGHPTERVASTVNLSFRFIEGEGILLNLDLLGIEVSTGSACSSGKLEASHVLLEMGLSQADAQGAIRFSAGEATSEEDIDFVLAELPPIIERLRAMSPLMDE